MPRRLAAVLMALAFVATAAAQDRLHTPAEFLGYELGSRFTPHHRVVAYVRHVAAASDRVTVEQYGETYEGRPLLLAHIASPTNHARLDAVRQNNLRLASQPEDAATGATIDAPPAIVWLSYNVHGNESVSTEAAMATLYDLANPENARTQAWLENTVVLLDPCINPDGRDRYVHWYNQMVGRFPNANPDAREHHEPWPGGRTNHYHFDLNRDWAWMTQVETQQRLPRYNAWLPHVHVDFHEQGVNSPYYFAPAAEPYHEDITDWQRELQVRMGQNHARYFDAEGWLYFTGQVFDLLYPGYGDTWPMFNGAVGMTYEQGGSGRAGLGIRTAEGDTLTLADRIAHHHTTGLSTVETASANAAEVVAAFADYHQAWTREPAGGYQAYVVKASSGADRVAALADHLTRQGIHVGYATQRSRATGFHYRTGETGPVEVAPGDLVVSHQQPKSTLVKVLFEPRTAVADSLTYDITGWALPYAYGVEAVAITQRSAPFLVANVPPAAASSPGVRPNLAQPYAYLAEWKSTADMRFLADVLRQGVKLRFATKPFEIDGRAYDPGTLILTRTGNDALPGGFDAVVRAAAERHGQPLHAVATGAVTRGADFGSGEVPFLAAPRVAVVIGASVFSGAAGEVWHFFDQQIGYPVTLLHPDDLRDTDLGDYDVLILPSGAYGSILGETQLADVRAWVRGGGRLIAVDNAADYLAGKEGFHLTRKRAAEKADTAAAANIPPARRFADRERADLLTSVPGAIFRVNLDATHPLGYGYGTTYFTLKTGDDAFAYLTDESDWNVGVLPAEALVSGFAGTEAQAQLAETLVFGVQRMGRGRVVYLVDNPLFRGFWDAGKLLFGNAVFMVGQ